MKTALLLASFALLSAIDAWAGDVGDPGTCAFSVHASDLVSGAGSNLTSSQESIAGVTTITINNSFIVVPLAWQLKARLASGTWPSGVNIWVKRTSGGTPGLLSTITGGTAYTQLTSTDTTIFTGSGDRTNINLRYQLTGLSVAAAPTTYSKSVIFTLQ